MAGANDAARSDHPDPQFMIVFLRHVSNPLSILRNLDLVREISLTIPLVARSTTHGHEWSNDEIRMSNAFRCGRQVATILPFLIRASSLIRHSTFVLRHSINIHLTGEPVRGSLRASF